MKNSVKGIDVVKTWLYMSLVGLALALITISVQVYNVGWSFLNS